MLIAVIYIYTGTYNLISYFVDKSGHAALLSLVIGLGTAWLALMLTGARSWSVLSRLARTLIADYGATAAIVFFCFVPYMGGNYDLTPDSVGAETDDTIATLDVPSTFEPSTSRSWIINPADCPVWAIFFAIIPALILTVLFFFDHNVSSLLCQAPEFGLKKGSAYHWDFFVIGIQIFITGMLGIPPVNGLIPQAPLHTDSLCEKAFRQRRVTHMNNHGATAKVEVIVGCHEQRVSALAQAVLIGLTLAVIDIIGYIPIAALDGLFLYMGIASFGGNTFFSRILLFITDRERLDARGLACLHTVPRKTIHQFTALQLVILIAIFGVTLAPYVEGLFPVLIAVLVPLRIYTLPKLFGADNVDAMDAAGEPPQQATVVEHPPHITAEYVHDHASTAET